MNKCKTINDFRNIIIDRCQDCDFLVNCMYGDFDYPYFPYHYSPLCYVSISVCIDYLDRCDIL